jgi:hypothetical protein
MTGQVDVATSASQPNKRSFAANASGFIVQSLTLGGTSPNLYTVGVNKQPPVTMVVRDAIRFDVLVDTIEIYNSSTTTALSVTGVIFRGVYAPSANSISTITGIGNGLFTPLATSVSTLAALATVGLTAGCVIEYVDSTTAALVTWVLTFNNSSPVTGPGITVPSDYNASSNPYVWIQV